MKRLARRWFTGSLIAVLSACTGVAPPHSTPAPVAVRSVTSHAAPGSAAATTTVSVVAAVTGYYRAIVARDYRRAFGYLAPGATGPDGRELTLPSFLQLARMLDGEGGPVTRFSVGGFPSEVVMTLYRVRYGPYHAHLRTTRTRHGWAISSIDRI
jgi:hypothetical protein